MKPRCKLVSSLSLLLQNLAGWDTQKQLGRCWMLLPTPWQWPMAASKHFFLNSNFKLKYLPYESWLEDKNSTLELFTALDTLLDAESEWDLFALQKWLTTCPMMTRVTSFVIWEVLWWSTTTCWSRLLLRLDQWCKIWTSLWCTLRLRPRTMVRAFPLTTLYFTMTIPTN